MSIETDLRNLQDKLKNQGWKIEKIPWQEDGKLEWVPNTKITSLLGCGGMIGFLSAWILLFTNSISVPTGISIAIGSLLIAFLSRALMAHLLYKNWVLIKAKCLELDVKKGFRYSNKSSKREFWNFRILCEFKFNGEDYKVTPEIPVSSDFYSEKSLQKYVSKSIDEEYYVKLWINPSNPLQTVLNRKPKMA